MRASSGIARSEGIPPSPRLVTLTAWSMSSSGLMPVGTAVSELVVTHLRTESENGAGRRASRICDFVESA